MKSKRIAVVLLFSGIVAAHAGEKILLDREEITAQSANLTLIRTASTPSKVRISLPIAAMITECVGGWEKIREPMGRNSNCPDGYEHPRGMSGPNCATPREVCRAYAKVPAKEWRKVVLKFKDPATLVGGEEAYALSARQNPKHENGFDFDLRSISIGAKHRIIKRSGEVLSIRLANPRFIIE